VIRIVKPGRYFGLFEGTKLLALVVYRRGSERVKARLEELLVSIEKGAAPAPTPMAKTSSGQLTARRPYDLGQHAGRAHGVRHEHSHTAIAAIESHWFGSLCPDNMHSIPMTNHRGNATPSLNARGS
jgi:hypothetical protein